MVITVAGEKKEVKDGLTLPELIEQENVEMPEYVTVSVNEEFIATEDKESTVLKEGDNVEFLWRSVPPAGIQASQQPAKIPHTRPPVSIP